MSAAPVRSTASILAARSSSASGVSSTSSSSTASAASPASEVTSSGSGESTASATAPAAAAPEVAKGDSSTAPPAATSTTAPVAAKDDAQADSATVDGEHTGGPVPYGALKSERQKRQEASDRAHALERENAELRGKLSVLQPDAQKQGQQQQAQGEDLTELYWKDPVKFTRSVAEQAVFNTRVETSLEDMIEKHGKEDYYAKEAAFLEAIASDRSGSLRVEMSRSTRPAKFAYDTGEAYLTAKDAGGTMGGLRKKIEAELTPQIEARILKKHNIDNIESKPGSTASVTGAGETTTPPPTTPRLSTAELLERRKR